MIPTPYLARARQTQNSEFADWFDNTTAEYQMMGYSLKESKEKAMSDWHTYEESRRERKTK